MTAVLNYKFKDNQKNKEHRPCKEWSEVFDKTGEEEVNKEKYKRIKIYGSAITLSIMNATLRIVLGYMSELERKHTETERLASAVNKMWIVQYLNGAIVLLLTGTRHSKLL